MMNEVQRDLVQDNMVAAQFRRASTVPCIAEVWPMNLTKVLACVDIQPICSNTCLV